MLKLLIILNIFGLILIGTESKNVVESRSCLDVEDPDPTLEPPLQFYHLVLRCAKRLTEIVVSPDLPYKQCIWLDNLKYCTKRYIENENVDCSEEIRRMIRDSIDEQRTQQGKWEPRCFQRFVE